MQSLALCQAKLSIFFYYFLIFFYFFSVGENGSICACAALRWPCVRLWAAWA